MRGKKCAGKKNVTLVNLLDDFDIGPPVELYSAASLDSQRYASSFPSPGRLFRCPGRIFQKIQKEHGWKGPIIMEVGNWMSPILVSFCLG